MCAYPVVAMETVSLPEATHCCGVRTDQTSVTLCATQHRTRPQLFALKKTKVYLHYIGRHILCLDVVDQGRLSLDL